MSQIPVKKRHWAHDGALARVIRVIVERDMVRKGRACKQCE
jgi:hypothetical protein